MSKNKDMNKFQHDVQKQALLPSSQPKQSLKMGKEDRMLKVYLEKNLEDPHNKWTPKDHSKFFMSNLRKYH